MVDSVDELKSSRTIQGYTQFPNFEMLDARIASAFNKIIQNSYFKTKVSLEEQTAQKEDRFQRGRQIAFIIYDYLRVTGALDTVLDFADLFSITLRNDNVQEFDTRWDEFLLPTTKIPSDDILESLYKLRIRESDQLKTVLELYDMEIHQKISMPNHQKLKTMVKRSIDQKLRSRNFDARHEKIETGAVVKSRRGFQVALKEEEAFVTSGKKQGSVRRRINAVSGMRVMIVQNRHQKPRHPLSHQHQKHEFVARREKETSEAEASLGSSIDSRVNTSWKVLALNHLVKFGILPNANSINLNRVVNSAQSAYFRTGRLKKQPNKRPKKSFQNGKSDRGAVAIGKNCTSIGLCLAGLRAVRTSEKNEVSVKPEAESFGINSTGTIHTVYATSSKYPENIKVHRLVKYTSKFLISEVPTLWNLRTDLQERPKDKSDAPAVTRGDLPKIFTSSKRRTKLHSVRPSRSGFCRPHPRYNPRKESLW